MSESSLSSRASLIGISRCPSVASRGGLYPFTIVDWHGGEAFELRTGEKLADFVDDIVVFVGQL